MPIDIGDRIEFVAQIADSIGKHGGGYLTMEECPKCEGEHLIPLPRESGQVRVLECGVIIEFVEVRAVFNGVVIDEERYREITGPMQ